MAAPKGTSYIQMMVNQYGEDWLVAISPESIQRSGRRIVKDMVKGIIDYQKFGMYFLDGKFLDNLIIYVQNELQVNTLYLNALSFYRQYHLDAPDVGNLITHVDTLCHIYNDIYSRLTAIKANQNISSLATTASVLYNYRNHLN
jgi:hypothetical protein